MNDLEFITEVSRLLRACKMLAELDLTTIRQTAVLRGHGVAMVVEADLDVIARLAARAEPAVATYLELQR